MSTQDQSSEDAQREALQHNLAYLDVLPQDQDQDQEGSIGDTDAALNSLFGEGNLQQYETLGMETNASDKGQQSQLDDVAVGEAAAESTRRDLEDHQLDEHPQIPPSAEQPNLSSTDTTAAAGANNPPVKRKATSRANMLARGGACEYCKRRKLKCSAEQPKCAACARLDRECVYSQKQQKSRVRVLEDRLAELEKKLGGAAREGSGSGAGSVPPQPEPGASANPDGVMEAYPDSVYAAINASTSASGSGSAGASTFISPMAHVPAGVHDEFQYGEGLPSGLDLGFSLDYMGAAKDVEVEPDLMTLADAATHDRIQAGGKYPWDGLTADRVIVEILNAVSGGKGIGEKIVMFLLQSYISPRNPQSNLILLDPTSILPRLSPRSTSPLHPSLILSIIILVLPFLPLSAFTSTSTASTVASALLGPARTYSAEAYATSDSRLLDTVAAQAIRAIAFFHQGRFLDGWMETSGSAAMAWACGLGKLAGVGQRFLGQGEKGEGWDERCRREEELRTWRFKGVVVPPPQTKKEYGERVRLFWGIYMLDKCAAIGWGWPSSFDDNEITTPWPSESYETPDILRSTSSLGDFLSSPVVEGQTDTAYCSLLKVMTLLFRATRLFDSKTSPEDTQSLLRVAKGYMSTLPAVQQQSSGEWGVQQGPINSNWMILHGAIALLHAKADIDTASMSKQDIKDCIASCAKVVECIELAREMGDFAFDGYDISTASTWAIVGRTAYKLSERVAGEHQLQPLASIGVALPRYEDVRVIGEKIVEALKVMGKRMPYAANCAQILENISMGSEAKVGEWVRPDWTNP